MSKKHFQALAWELAHARPCKIARPQCYEERMYAWRNAVDAVVTVAREANSRFDVQRFLDACHGSAEIRDGKRHMVDASGRQFSV